MEKTLTIIKPDAMINNVSGQIISILEKSGLKIVAAKMVHLTFDQANNFYQEHYGKIFFPSMIKFICSYPVLVLCLQGENAIALQRKLIGATNPQEAEKSTIRKLFGKNIESNAVHGSDSLQAAEREIEIFFKKEEIIRIK